MTTKTKIDRHVWTENEERLAIQLYTIRATDEQVAKAVKSTDLKLASLKMKLSNIRFLDTGFGLSNVSQLTKKLFDESNGLTRIA